MVETSSGKEPGKPTRNHIRDIQEGEVISARDDSSPTPSDSPGNPPVATEDVSSVRLGGESYTAEHVQPEDVRKAVDEAKKDFITIFGLFAALLIFLSVVVQVFQEAKRFSYVMGVSLFMLSAMLAFALAIHSLFNSEIRWTRYWPVLVLVILFFVASAACFLWGIEHTLAFWHWHLFGNPSV